jgi:hypothetical protein
VLRDLTEDKVSWITQWRGQQARALDTLYELAYQMQRQNLSALPIRDALTIIARVRDNREYALEEMLDSLIEQDLLARAGGDAVRFLYSQYQAYCCAQYLCRQNNTKLWEEITASLGRIAHLRRWRPSQTTSRPAGKDRLCHFAERRGTSLSGRALFAGSAAGWELRRRACE